MFVAFGCPCHEHRGLLGWEILLFPEADVMQQVGSLRNSQSELDAQPVRMVFALHIIQSYFNHMPQVGQNQPSLGLNHPTVLFKTRCSLGYFRGAMIFSWLVKNTGYPKKPKLVKGKID